MPTLTLPQVTPKMQTGTVRRWLKKLGDTVNQGEALLEVETDDGLVEVESTVAGQLTDILTPAGKTVPIHAPLAVLNGDAKMSLETRGTSSPAQSTLDPHGASPAAKSVTPVLMPKAGQSMEEGTIVEWKVKVGDTIKVGDVIFAVETDKATMDVEATDAGRLARIVLPAGGACQVMEPVAYLAANDADVDAFLATPGQAGVASVGQTVETKPTPSSPARAESQELPDQSRSVSGGEERVKASPAARRLASERGVDLSTLSPGHGPGGRILSTDVPLPSPGVPPVQKMGTGETPMLQQTTRRRMSKMRRVIARNLCASKQTIPHFYIRQTIVADLLYGFYQGEKAKYPCSLNDVVVMACAKTIMEFPAFRSRIEGEEIVKFPSAHIGIAVGMEEGLVVPVVVGAERLTLKQLGSETKRIANTAKSGKIEGLGQGVFTITNLGMFGTDEFDAIINPPEAAILAVGALREDVIVSGGTLRAGRVMTLTLSCDHRLIDGVLAAKFLARLTEILEWPGQL